MKRPGNRQAGQSPRASLLDPAGDPARRAAGNTEDSSRAAGNRTGLITLLLLAATVVAYLPIWKAGFIWDDDTFLLQNPLIRTPDGLLRLWFTASTPDYFPLTSTTLWLEWRLWGANPLGYHLVNVLLHALSAVVLWQVLARLRIPGACLAAAIFALHPVNVESVAWITERKNTLAMFLYLLALWWFLRFEDTGQRRWYGLAAGAFVLALLSKTAVAPLPLVLLGLAWWQRGRLDFRDVWRAVPFFVLAVLAGLVSLWFQYHRAIGDVVVRADDFWSRLAGAGWAIWFYLGKAVVPLDLSFIYPRWGIDAGRGLSYAPGFLVVGGFLVCWRCRRGWGRPVLFGLGYSVVMLLPILGFLNIYFMRYSLAADHWQYFAIIGPTALAATGLTLAFERRADRQSKVPGQGSHSPGSFPHPMGRGREILRPTVIGGLLVALGALTWRQCGIYVHPETLWRDTLARNPSAWMAHSNLGKVLVAEGQGPDAQAQFRAAIRMEPDAPEPHADLGNLLAEQGRLEEAEAQYATAIRLRPDYYVAYYNMGNLFAGKKDYPKAVQYYSEATRLNPNFANAWYNLGNTLALEGRYSKAVPCYCEAIRLNPDALDMHNNLAASYLKLGKAGLAAAQFQEMLRLAPDDADTHYRLGFLLEQHGEKQEAEAQYREALRINPDHEPASKRLRELLPRQPGQP